jgi:probable rRNA maturation factor
MSLHITYQINQPYIEIFTSELKMSLKHVIVSVLKDHSYTDADIRIKLTDNEEMLLYNKEFLQHDYYTDILTFPMTTDNGFVEADILISYDMILHNSKQFNVSFQHELFRVVTHGVLHLCGYDDHTEADIKIMRQKEEYYIKQASTIFVPRETI